MEEELKITFISDTHNLHEKVVLEGGDLLVHTGDALEYGSMLELVNFANWIKKAPYKEIIYVPGNHDGAVNFLKKMSQEDQKSIFGNVHVLVDQFIEVLGLKIFGSPYSLTFADYSFMKDESEMMSSFGKAPFNLDILATHSPVKGILDEIVLLDNSRLSIGSQTLTDIVKERKPKISCFGHAHDSRGIKQIGDTVFVNSNVFGSSFNKGEKILDPINILYNKKNKDIIVLGNHQEESA